MDAWIIWLLLAVAFTVGEVLTISFFLAPFAVGGFAAAATSALGGDTGASVAVFAIVTALSLWLVRPIARRHIRQPRSTITGTAALVGRTGVVVQQLEGPERTGLVRIDGEVWSARSAGLGDIEAGETVTVLEIDGATVVVTD